MIKKLLCLCVILFTVYSCDDLTYSGSSKVVYTGRITDASGTPVSGIPVSIFIQKNGSPGVIYPGSSNKEEVISYTTTNDDGSYTMIFPTPENESAISLLINRDENGQVFNNVYSNIGLYNIGKPGASNNFTIDSGDNQVFKIAEATTLRVIANDNWHNITPVGIINNQIIYANEGVHQYYRYTLNYDQREYTFTVAKNQTILLRYTSGYYTDYYTEVPVYVGESPITYTIE